MSLATLSFEIIFLGLYVRLHHMTEVNRHKGAESLKSESGKLYANLDHS